MKPTLPKKSYEMLFSCVTLCNKVLARRADMTSSQVDGPLVPNGPFNAGPRNILFFGTPPVRQAIQRTFHKKPFR
jgi:hypothetical protein